MARHDRQDAWLLGYLWPEWRALSAGVLVMSVRAVVLLLLPWPLKYTIDNVIFDRPLPAWLHTFSSLDARTERELMLALARLASRRAALVIAHRLSTVMNADLILVLDHGRIVQRGTHAELLAVDGLYAGLWQALRDDNPVPRLRMVNP